MLTSDKSDTDYQGSIHVVIGCLMALAAGASGWMSLTGAESIFNSYLLSAPFAIVVQGSICVSLWLLPKNPLRIKAMLLCIAAVGMSFSISSAYLSSTRSQHADQATVSAQQQLSEWMAAVAATGNQISHEIKTAEARAACEINPECVGTANASKGPKYRAAIQRVESAKAQHQLFLSEAGIPLQRMRDEVSAQVDAGASAVDLKNLLNKYRAEIPASYHTDIVAPTFATETFGPIQRMGDLWKSLSVDSGDFFEIYFALIVAALMEALTFLLAMTRFAIESEGDPRNMRERLVDGFALVKSLNSVGDDAEEGSKVIKSAESVRLSEKKARVSKQRDRLPSTKRSTSKKRAAPSENFIALWTKAIQYEATANKCSITDVMTSVLSIHGKFNKDGEEQFSEKDLSKRPVLKRALIESQALIATSDGGMKRGPGWTDFLIFMFKEAPTPAISSGMHLVKTGT